MKLAKSIDELYDEVKDFDIVLCNDAPLATALNNRISRPFIGEFAVTPRQLAGDLGSLILKGPVLDDIEIVRIISERTGYTLRFVHGEIENIKRIRRYTKDVYPHLYGRSKKIYDEYVKLKTTDKVMENFDGENNPIYKDKRVAVIGIDLYDELDKYVNPKFGTFEEIRIFKRGKYTIPEIRVVGNNREIAENIASLITPDNCRDVAIVMDVGGPLAASIKSALYKNKIPFINKLVVKDLKQTRDFIEFISLSLMFDYLKIGHIREIIGSYGGFIKPRYDNYLARDFKLEINGRTENLLELMKNIRDYTFDQIRDKIVEKSKKGQVKLLLEEVGVLDKKITNAVADDLFYAVNNINDLKHNEQIPAHEKEGVLLVDCVNSVFIDRPIVIYAGIGPEWEKDICFLNDIDYRMKDDEVDRNVIRFQTLLQQGQKRLYVVNSIKEGRTATPCSYFDHCNDGKVCKKFADVCDNVVEGPWSNFEGNEDRKYKDDIHLDTHEDGFSFSSSSYNSFKTCPRAFMFGRLLDDPEKDSTITGNYLHAYAEFRAIYPERASEHDVEYYVDFISDRCLSLYTPEKRVLERSMLRASITNINEFLSNIDVSITFDEKIVKSRPNPFFDETYTSDQTERKYTISDEKIEGIIDLIGNEAIYDYKSGSPKPGIDISKEMSGNCKVDYGYNFQPLFYLYIMEKGESKAFDQFGFYFTKGNINNFTKGLTEGKYAVENLRAVYLVQSLEEFFVDHYVDHLFSDQRYSDLSYCRENLIKTITDYGLSDPEELKNNKILRKSVMDDSKNAKRLLEHISTDFKKFSKNLEERGSFDMKNNVFITPDTLSKFVKDLAVSQARYKEYLYGEFPATPKIDCKNCNFNDVCTATPIVEGGEEDFQTE